MGGVDDDAGARAGDQVIGPPRAGGGEDRPGAEVRRELHRGEPDRGAGAVHEHRLPGPQLRGAHQRVVLGQEARHRRRGLHVRPVAGHGDGEAMVEQRELRVASADQAHDPVADLDAAHRRAGLDHRAGGVHAGDRRAVPGQAGIVPSRAVREIGAVDRGRAHREQQLLRPGPGIGHLGELEGPVARDDHGHHRPRSVRRASAKLPRAAAADRMKARRVGTSKARSRPTPGAPPRLRPAQHKEHHR